MNVSKFFQEFKMLKEDIVTWFKDLSLLQGSAVNKTRSDLPSKAIEVNFVVDYSLSLQEMIEACDFDWYDKDINEKNFPIPIELKGKRIYRKAKIIHFHDYFSSQEAVFEAKKYWPQYRQATLAEQLAFAETYPDLKKYLAITIFGSIWSFIFSRVPVLDFSDNKRRLILGWYNRIWLSSNYILIVSK